MKALQVFLALATAAPVFGGNLMEDCEPGSRRMVCIHRNGVCVEVSIDGQATRPISRENRQRITQLPDMDEVCWEIEAPVSSAFRVEARGGGLQPDFIGELKSIGAILVPLDEYDPEFDGNRIEPLRGFSAEADGYRDGTWQLRARDHFRTPGSTQLPAGEYVIILRLHGQDNWDKQEVLIRIDPNLKPAPAKQGSAGR